MGEKTGQDTAWMRFSRSIRSGTNRSFQGTDLFSGIYELPFHHCRLTLDLNVQGIMIKDKDEGEDGSAGVRTQCMRLSRSKSNLVQSTRICKVLICSLAFLNFLATSLSAHVCTVSMPSLL
jgi:hypothetical protein